MPQRRGKSPRRPPSSGRKTATARMPPGKTVTRRKKGTPASAPTPDVKAADEDYDVIIAAWAKGESLVVREIRGVQVRTWSTHLPETLHVSTRAGLPEQLTPGAFGPFEAGMRVGTRLPKPPRAPGPVRPPAPPKKGPDRRRR